MRRRVFTFLVCLAGLVVWLNSSGQHAPRYQGKSVHYWFKQWVNVGGVWARPPDAFRELGGEAVPCLLAALKVKDSNFGRFYQELYAAVPDRLQKRLSRPIPAEVVRWKAARALQEIGPAAASTLPVLCAALKDPEPRLRSAVLNAIVAMGPAAKTATPYLLDALAVPDRWFRCFLSEAIIRLDDYPADAAPRIAEPFIDMLKTPDSTPYLNAAGALQRIRPVSRELLTGLVEALREQDEFLQRQSKINPQTAIQMRSNTFDTLITMARATDSSVPWLIDKLGDARSSVRALTATALGALGTLAQDAVPTLEELLTDTNARVQVAAAQALETIRPASGDGNSEAEGRGAK